MSSLEQTSSPESDGSPAGMDMKAAVVQELTRGLDRLSQLQALLQEEMPPSEDVSAAAGSLVQEVSGSISRVLSVLDPDQKVGEGPVDLATATAAGQQQSRKRKIQPPRRSCYRRRSHPYTCRKIVSRTVEDGYTWRKYGQKDIYGAKFPRNYYRCTHKYDRECQATRQVQRSEEDTSTFIITYMGEHTCMESESPLQGSTCIIDFSSNTSAMAGDRQEAPLSSSSLAPKQERDDEAVSSLTAGSSSSELLPMFPDLSELQCDVTSGLHYSYTSTLGTEFMNPEALDFDVMFSFIDQDGNMIK